MLEWAQARERGKRVLPLDTASGNIHKLPFVLSKRKTCFSALLPLGRQHVPGSDLSLSPGDMGHCQAESVKSRCLLSCAFFSVVANVRASLLLK